MCAVSFVADHYFDHFRPFEQTIVTVTVPAEELESLRREVQHMKEILKKAKMYDEKTGQPHCEKVEKIESLRRIAEAMGVTLDDVFPKPDTTK